MKRDLTLHITIKQHNIAQHNARQDQTLTYWKAYAYLTYIVQWPIQRTSILVLHNGVKSYTPLALQHRDVSMIIYRQCGSNYLRYSWFLLYPFLRRCCIKHIYLLWVDLCEITEMYKKLLYANNSSLPFCFVTCLQCLICNTSIMVEIMARRRTGNRSLPKPGMTMFSEAYTRPQLFVYSWDWISATLRYRGPPW